LLAGAWDTLGWVHFRLADLATAEEYLRAAWMLAQSGALGDHLGQLYERQGKTQAAIYAYQLALAAGGAPQWTRDRLASLGAAATSQPAAEELGKLRTTNVPALSKQQGSAEFFVLLSAGKAEDVQFISGAESLRGAGAALLQARFDFPFPDQEPEKLVRRGILSCSQYTTPNCQFVFLLPGSARK
jgi:tetratricopeptide (TPR) repeat protein